VGPRAGLDAVVRRKIPKELIHCEIGKHRREKAKNTAVTRNVFTKRRQKERKERRNLTEETGSSVSSIRTGQLQRDKFFRLSYFV
jgi:hypothetical protein